jgi:hypothetical protein
MESWTFRLLLAAGTFLIVTLCAAAPNESSGDRVIR